MPPEKLYDIIDQFRSWSVKLVIVDISTQHNTCHLSWKVQLVPIGDLHGSHNYLIEKLWANHPKANMYEGDPSWAEDVTWSCWEPVFSSSWSSPCVPKGGRAVASLRSGGRSWRRCSLSTRPRRRGGRSLLGRSAMHGLVQLTEISEYHCRTCPTPSKTLHSHIFPPLAYHYYLHSGNKAMWREHWDCVLWQQRQRRLAVSCQRHPDVQKHQESHGV